MMHSKKWKLVIQLWHTKFGILFFILNISLIIGGLASLFYRKKTKPFGTKKMMRFKKIHMYFGYFIYFFV